MATNDSPVAIVPVKAVLRTLTTLSHGSLPLCAYTGRADNRNRGTARRVRRRLRAQRKKGRRFDGRMLSTGFSFGGLSSSGHSRCNVLDVKVGLGRRRKSGK